MHPDSHPDRLDAADADADAEAFALATLARIERDDAEVRAFVSTPSAAQAVAQARALHGPLAGVAVGVKDIFDTADLPTGYGSPVYPPRPALADAAIVSVLRRAGALVIGKTSTTEFAYLHPTATRNPNAPGRTPGGSSAGSAAAVAAGLVPLAVGTQTGGSVIRPASYCGVVGYKPSFGWLPTNGLKCFSWSLDTVGLFTRDVGTMARHAAVLTGRPLETGPAPRVVAVPRAYPWGDPSPGMAAAVAHGADALRAAGVEVRPVDLPAWAAEGFAAHAVVQGHEAWRSLSREWEHHRAQLSPVLRDYLGECAAIGDVDYDRAQQAVVTMRQHAHAWLQGFDAVLVPSAPDEAPAGYESTGPSTFNRLWSLLGVPCVSVPGLVGPNGAPLGLQLVAPFGADAQALAAARHLERAIARPSGPITRPLTGAT